MFGRRFNRTRNILAAGALCVALAACGSVDSSTGLPTVTSTTSNSATSLPSTASAPPSVTVAPVAAAATLAISVDNGTATATVGTSAGTAAGGTVTFALDGTALGQVALANGQASTGLPAGLSVGDHTVTADFASDNATSVANGSATITFSAVKAGSTLTAAFGDTAVRYGDQETFTIAAQAPSAPAGTDLTGHVTVHDGDTVIAEGDTDPTGQASLSVLNRADPGNRTYTVSYSGNGAVDAATVPLAVQTTQTNVDLAIDGTDDVLAGTDATITVDVIGTPDAPTGTATISYDGAQIGGGPIDGNGKISATVSAVVAGDHQVQVSYAGDARFEPNTATTTLSAKDPVANPNAAGAAAAQASNPCPATASACVDLANEQAWLQTIGQITYGPVPITSGAAGSRTRTGTFSVFWLYKNHNSSLFNNAPMPNSVFFDNDIAFHQGSLSDQSNGCIHLSWDASETFFDTLSVGDSVYVWGAPPY
jgi:lipoprotein-anchoring transpeptidase ErfK/SrfK